jgi:uncharacterized cupredoxin-like copper-binding protein
MTLLRQHLSPLTICEGRKRQTFENGCLIPGHREAGMHGTVVVK